MSACQLFKTTIVGVLFLGAMVFSAVPALAANMWFQQAIFLAHIPIGGGLIFTVNQTFAANEGPVTINIKCFNDQFQRVGPPAGVNVGLSAAGQVAFHTPTTLGVTTDPLFTLSGAGWCWASNAGVGDDYNTQTTVGVTSDLTPGGILNSASSTFVATNSGLGETSSNKAGLPYFTTIGGAQSFLVIVNPVSTSRTITFELFDASGNPQGAGINRTLQGRGLISLAIPGAFGLATPPTSGSVRITSSTGTQGYLGWYLQVYPNGKAIFNSVGIDGDNRAQLPSAEAP